MTDLNVKAFLMKRPTRSPTLPMIPQQNNVRLSIQCWILINLLAPQIRILPKRLLTM